MLASLKKQLTMLAYEDPGHALRDLRKQLKQLLRNIRTPEAMLPLQQGLLDYLVGNQQEILRRAECELPCRPGCSLCCHLRVEPFAHEILLLWQRLQDMPEAERQAVEQRLRDNAARIDAIGREAHWITNIPCAFLIDDRCGVHEQRPLSCARYHSTELAACQRAHDDPAGEGDRRPVIPEFNLEGDVLIQAMRDALKASKRDHRSYEVNTGLVRLLDEPDLALRWQRLQSLFPMDRQND